MQRRFGVSPPSVHQMVLTLERLGLIRRQPGVALSIEVLLAPEAPARPPPSRTRQILCAEELVAGGSRGSWAVGGADLTGLAWFALSGLLSTAMARAAPSTSCPCTTRSHPGIRGQARDPLLLRHLRRGPPRGGSDRAEARRDNADRTQHRRARRARPAGRSPLGCAARAGRPVSSATHGNGIGPLLRGLLRGSEARAKPHPGRRLRHLRGRASGRAVLPRRRPQPAQAQGQHLGAHGLNEPLPSGHVGATRPSTGGRAEAPLCQHGPDVRSWHNSDFECMTGLIP